MAKQRYSYLGLLIILAVAACVAMLIREAYATPVNPWPMTDAQAEGAAKCEEKGKLAVFLHNPDKVLCNPRSKKQ